MSDYLLREEEEMQERARRIQRHEDPPDRPAERVAMHPECAEYPCDVLHLLYHLSTARHEVGDYQEIERRLRGGQERLTAEVERLREALSFMASRKAFIYWDNNGYGIWKCEVCGGYNHENTRSNVGINHESWCKVPLVADALAGCVPQEATAGT